MTFLDYLASLKSIAREPVVYHPNPGHAALLSELGDNVDFFCREAVYRESLQSAFPNVEWMRA